MFHSSLFASKDLHRHDPPTDDSEQDYHHSHHRSTMTRIHQQQQQEEEEELILEVPNLFGETTSNSSREDPEEQISQTRTSLQPRKSQLPLMPTGLSTSGSSQSASSSAASGSITDDDDAFVDTETAQREEGTISLADVYLEDDEQDHEQEDTIEDDTASATNSKSNSNPSHNTPSSNNDPLPPTPRTSPPPTSAPRRLPQHHHSNSVLSLDNIAATTTLFPQPQQQPTSSSITRRNQHSTTTTPLEPPPNLELKENYTEEETYPANTPQTVPSSSLKTQQRQYQSSTPKCRPAVLSSSFLFHDRKRMERVVQSQTAAWEKLQQQRQHEAALLWDNNDHDTAGSTTIISLEQQHEQVDGQQSTHLPLTVQLPSNRQTPNTISDTDSMISHNKNCCMQAIQHALEDPCCLRRKGTLTSQEGPPENNYHNGPETPIIVIEEDEDEAQSSALDEDRKTIAVNKNSNNNDKDDGMKDEWQALSNAEQSLRQELDQAVLPNNNSPNERSSPRSKSNSRSSKQSLSPWRRRQQRRKQQPKDESASSSRGRSTTRNLHESRSSPRNHSLDPPPKDLQESGPRFWKLFSPDGQERLWNRRAARERQRATRQSSQSPDRRRSQSPRIFERLNWARQQNRVGHNSTNPPVPTITVVEYYQPDDGTVVFHVEDENEKFAGMRTRPTPQKIMHEEEDDPWLYLDSESSSNHPIATRGLRHQRGLAGDADKRTSAGKSFRVSTRGYSDETQRGNTNTNNNHKTTGDESKYSSSDISFISLDPTKKCHPDSEEEIEIIFVEDDSFKKMPTHFSHDDPKGIVFDWMEAEKTHGTRLPTKDGVRSEPTSPMSQQTREIDGSIYYYTPPVNQFQPTNAAANATMHTALAHHQQSISIHSHLEHPILISDAEQPKKQSRCTSGVEDGQQKAFEQSKGVSTKPVNARNQKGIEPLTIAKSNEQASSIHYPPTGRDVTQIFRPEQSNKVSEEDPSGVFAKEVLHSSFWPKTKNNNLPTNIDSSQAESEGFLISFQSQKHHDDSDVISLLSFDDRTIDVSSTSSVLPEDQRRAKLFEHRRKARSSVYEKYTNNNSRERSSPFRKKEIANHSPRVEETKMEIVDAEKEAFDIMRRKQVEQWMDTQSHESTTRHAENDSQISTINSTSRGSIEKHSAINAQPFRFPRKNSSGVDPIGESFGTFSSIIRGSVTDPPLKQINKRADPDGYESSSSVKNGGLHQSMRTQVLYEDARQFENSANLKGYPSAKKTKMDGTPSVEPQWSKDLFENGSEEKDEEHDKKKLDQSDSISQISSNKNDSTQSTHHTQPAPSAADRARALLSSTKEIRPTKFPAIDLLDSKNFTTPKGEVISTISVGTKSSSSKSTEDRSASSSSDDAPFPVPLLLDTAETVSDKPESAATFVNEGYDVDEINKDFLELASVVKNVVDRELSSAKTNKEMIGSENRPMNSQDKVAKRNFFETDEVSFSSTSEYLSPQVKLAIEMAKKDANDSFSQSTLTFKIPESVGLSALPPLPPRPKSIWRKPFDQSESVNSLPSVIKTGKPSSESRSSVSLTATFDGEPLTKFPHSTRRETSTIAGANTKQECHTICASQSSSGTSTLIDLDALDTDKDERGPTSDWTKEYKVPGESSALRKMNSNDKASNATTDIDSRSTMAFKLTNVESDKSSTINNEQSNVPDEGPHQYALDKRTLSAQLFPYTKSLQDRESSGSSTVESLPGKVKRAISQARRQITSDNDSRSTLTFQIPTDVEASQGETSLSINNNKRSVMANSEKSKPKTKGVKFHLAAPDHPAPSHSPISWSPNQPQISGILKHSLVHNQNESIFHESDASTQLKAYQADTEEKSLTNDQDTVVSRELGLKLITEIPMSGTSHGITEQSSHEQTPRPSQPASLIQLPPQLLKARPSNDKIPIRSGEKRSKATSSAILERARKVLDSQKQSKKFRSAFRKQRRSLLRAESRDEASDSIDSRTKIAVLDNRIQHIVQKARIMSRQDGDKPRRSPTQKSESSQVIHRNVQTGYPPKDAPGEMTITFDPSISRSHSTLTYPQEIRESPVSSSTSRSTQDTPYPESLFPRRLVKKDSSSSTESAPSMLPDETTQKILQQAFDATHNHMLEPLNLPPAVKDAFDGHDIFDEEEESIRTSDAGDSGFQVLD